MKTRIFLLMLVVLILVSNCTNGGGSNYKKFIEKKIAIHPEGQINIVSLQGNIEISTHKGGDIHLTALVESDSTIGPEETVFKLEWEGKSLNILPAAKRTKPEVSIDYILEVPEQLQAVLLTARSGDVRAKGSYKKLEINTVNGAVVFQGEFSGCAFSSSNGDMDIRVTDTLKGGITARNINGNVTVTLYPDSGFHVIARTAGGTIQTDFEIPITKDTRGQQLTGTVNNGAHGININTVNGSIKLLKH